MILYTDILYNIIYIIYIYLGEANKAVRCPHTPEGDCNRRRAKPVAPNGADLPSQRLRRPPQHVKAHSGSGRRPRANARMKLRVLGTLLGRSNEAQHNSAAREETRFCKAE